MDNKSRNYSTENIRIYMNHTFVLYQTCYEYIFPTFELVSFENIAYKASKLFEISIILFKEE